MENVIPTLRKFIFVSLSVPSDKIFLHARVKFLTCINAAHRNRRDIGSSPFWQFTPLFSGGGDDTTSAMVILNSFGFGDKTVAETVLGEQEHFRYFFCQLKLFPRLRDSYPENGRGKAKTESKKKVWNVTSSGSTDFPL